MEMKDFGEVTIIIISNDCGIRTRGFYDEDGEVWFFAEDLINSLEYTEPAIKVVQKYCNDAVTGTMSVGGHKKKYMVVTGGDMWNLALHAPSKRAREFQRFVLWHTLDCNGDTNSALHKVIDEE